MKKSAVMLGVWITTSLFTCAFAQTNMKVKDYLNLPGPVIFENNNYVLSWSSHPSDNFYKQEYILKGEKIDKFGSMILIDVVTSDTQIKNIVSMKIEELKKMKVANPIVNYEIFEKNGEYIIDFLLSVNGADGNLAVLERNVYRYKSQTNKSGKNYVTLFGVCTRSYGDETTPFLTSLKASKSVLVNAVAAYRLPAILVEN